MRKKHNLQIRSTNYHLNYIIMQLSSYSNIPPMFRCVKKPFSNTNNILFVYPKPYFFLEYYNHTTSSSSAQICVVVSQCIAFKDINLNNHNIATTTTKPRKHICLIIVYKQRSQECRTVRNHTQPDTLLRTQHNTALEYS